MKFTVAVAPKAAGASAAGRPRNAVVAKAHGQDSASKLMAGLSAAVIAGSAMLPPDAIAMAPAQSTEQNQIYVRPGQRSGDAGSQAINGVAELPDPKKKLAEQEAFPSPLDLGDAAKTVKRNIKNISDEAGSRMPGPEAIKDGAGGAKRTLEQFTEGPGPKVVVNRGEGGPIQVNKEALDSTADAVKGSFQNTGRTTREIVDQTTQAVRRNVGSDNLGSSSEIKEAGKGLVDSVKDAAENTKQAIFSTGDDAARKAKEATRGLQDAGSSARDKLDEAGRSVNRNVQKAVAFNFGGKDAGAEINQAGKDLADKAKGSTTSLKDSVKDAAANTKQALFNTGDDASRKVKDAGNTARDKLDDAARSVNRNQPKPVAYNTNQVALGSSNVPVGKDNAPEANQTIKESASQLLNNAKDSSLTFQDSVKDAAENTKQALFNAGDETSRKVNDASRGLKDAGNSARDKVDDAGRTVNRNLQKPVSFPLTDVTAEPVSLVAFGKDVTGPSKDSSAGESSGPGLKDAAGAVRSAVLNAKDETARKAQEASQGLQDTRKNPRAQGPSSDKKTVAYEWALPSRVSGVEAVAFEFGNKNPGDKAREEGQNVKPITGSETLVPSAKNNAAGGGLGQNYDSNLTVRQNFEKAKENFDNTSPKPPTGAPDFGKRFGAPNEVQGLKLSAGLGFPLFGQPPSLSQQNKAPQPNNPPNTETDPQAQLNGDIPSPTIPIPLPSPVTPYPLTNVKKNVEAAERSMTPIPEPKPQTIKDIPQVKNANGSPNTLAN